MSTVSRRAGALLVVLGASALLVGCASSTTDKGSATPAKTGSAAAKSTTAADSGTVSAELSEWAVKASGAGKAGPVKFNVKNAGSIPHEFVVLKTDADQASLSKDANGVVDVAKYSPAGSTKQIEVGATETLNATLTAGKYVLLCNIAGHYDLGMHTALTVN